jgi:hypothetical protein
MSLDEHKGEAPSAWRIATMAWRSVSAAAGGTPTAFLIALAIIAAVLVAQRLTQHSTSVWVFANSAGWIGILKSRVIALAFDVMEAAAGHWWWCRFIG